MKIDKGYIYIKKPNHPFATKEGYVYEHRLKMEEYLRKTNPKSKYLIKVKEEFYLNPKCIPHHKNKIPWDNRIKNLEIKNYLNI